MHTTAENVDETFGLFDNQYLLVHPVRGMGDGIEVSVAFNGTNKRTFKGDSAREDAIEYAQDYAAMQDMDGVLAFHPPERAEDDA
jgi:hypothetical protein